MSWWSTLRTKPVNEQEQDARTAASEAITQLQKIPLVREYARYRLSNPIARNVAGWHARGEQLVMALQLYGSAIDPSLAILSAGLEGGPTAPAVRQLQLATQIWAATPYLWTDQIYRAIRSSPALPSHVVSRTILPFPLMYWSFETAYPLLDVGISTKTGALVAAEINWMLVVDQGDSFVVIHDQASSARDQAHTPLSIVGGKMPYGMQWPEDAPDATRGMGTTAELVLRMLAFLNSPYVAQTEEALPRALRRRQLHDITDPALAERENKATIHVVALRKRTPPTENTAEGETAASTWQHQWWVTGHFRAQWYASTKSHKVVWIAPYLKGPTDKPVLDKVYAVKR